jgi:hypothetical protein
MNVGATVGAAVGTAVGAADLATEGAALVSRGFRDGCDDWRWATGRRDGCIVGDQVSNCDRAWQ